MFKYYITDLKAVLEKDPAARNWFEVICTYSGFKALRWHRFCHFLFRHKMKFLARLFSQFSRFLHGIEIHPGAIIGKGVFIDHGMGLVIGETTEIGDNVVIYQGVTLGGTGKDTGKRHPTIKSNVMLCAGCKVLGPITVGENCKIGAQAVVLKDVPPNCTVVGVPGKVVKIDGQPVADMDQTNPVDPVTDELSALRKRLKHLESLMGLNPQDDDECVITASDGSKYKKRASSADAKKILHYNDDYHGLGDELEHSIEEDDEIEHGFDSDYSDDGTACMDDD